VPAPPTDVDFPGSLFRQALVARRQQAFCFSASTVMECEPAHFQQMAGLICYYGGTKFTTSTCHTTSRSVGACE
jgi:beta-xylosidase